MAEFLAFLRKPGCGGSIKRPAPSVVIGLNPTNSDNRAAKLLDSLWHNNTLCVDFTAHGGLTLV